MQRRIFYYYTYNKCSKTLSDENLLDLDPQLSRLFRSRNWDRGSKYYIYLSTDVNELYCKNNQVIWGGFEIAISNNMSLVCCFQLSMTSIFIFICCFYFTYFYDSSQLIKKRGDKRDDDDDVYLKITTRGVSQNLNRPIRHQ